MNFVLHLPASLGYCASLHLAFSVLYSPNVYQPNWSLLRWKPGNFEGLPAFVKNERGHPLHNRNKWPSRVGAKMHFSEEKGRHQLLSRVPPRATAILHPLRMLTLEMLAKWGEIEGKHN